ncbi:hypothetical protein MIR68_006473 [Amoeboaphelidium protococcarum]|nr:hypothetical protein MIR68_006473 [Amoeboaphelidium protococcarum]
MVLHLSYSHNRERSLSGDTQHAQCTESRSGSIYQEDYDGHDSSRKFDQSQSKQELSLNVNSIPAEIVHAVLSNCQSETLLIAMQINKKWRTVAGSILYRDPFNLPFWLCNRSGDKDDGAGGQYRFNQSRRNRRNSLSSLWSQDSHIDGRQSSHTAAVSQSFDERGGGISNNGGWLSKMWKLLTFNRNGKDDLQTQLDLFLLALARLDLEHGGGSSKKRALTFTSLQQQSQQQIQSRYKRVRQIKNLQKQQSKSKVSQDAQPYPALFTWIRHLDFGPLIQAGEEEVVVDDLLLDLISGPFQNSSQLISISLGGASLITDQGLLQLSLRNCTSNITKLDLSHLADITEHSLCPLLMQMKYLRCINLKGCKQVGDSVLRTIATYCSHIERLRLAGTKITDDGLKWISQSAITSLQYLDLNCCNGISDQGIIAVVQSQSELRWIDLTRQSKHKSAALLTDASILAVAQNCPRLELLDLSYCSQITDAPLIALTENCQRLKSLSLKGLNLITAESVFALGELRRTYHHLIWLQIYNCRNITSQVIDQMIQNLNDGWRKGPYDKSVHTQVMGATW